VSVASTDGATLKVFDADNSPQTQFSQLQGVINSGPYNGIIVQPIFGTGLTRRTGPGRARSAW
jgi:ribose transport system substrate-binding protein